jgi:hypothetical protein
VAELTGGVLAPADQGRADAAPLERAQDLQVAEGRHPREAPADRRLGGGFAVQEHVADRPPVDQGDQQDPASGPLPAQAAGEEVPLPKGRHQPGQVSLGGWPDLHLTPRVTPRPAP